MKGKHEMNTQRKMTKAECLANPELYPWAGDMAENDCVSTESSWTPGTYLDRFSNEIYPSGKESFGDIRYYVFDPTAHGFPKNGSYPLLFALHGSGGSFVGKTAISWAGAERLASPEWQEAVGGMYIIVPLANESRDSEGDTQHTWMTPVSGKPYDGYTAEEIERIPHHEHWGSLCGNDSVYTKTLMALLRSECEKHPAIGRKIVSGASAGGYGAWRMIISHPDAFDAALFMAGAYIPSLRELKILENAGMRLWICHGRRDECVPFDMVIRPILPILQGMPGTELYLPDFVRRANGCVASNLSGIQMGQHCINDEMQENLMFLDGTPMDPLHPEGFIGWLKKVTGYER